MQYTSRRMSSNWSSQITAVSHAATHDTKHIQSVMSAVHKYHN